MFTSLQPFDLAVAHVIQSWQPAWLTMLMKDTSLVSSPELLAVVGLVITVFYWFRRDGLMAMAVFFLTAGNGITLALKHIFDRPRPDPAVLQVLVHETGRSFPSGHAIGIVLFVATITTITAGSRPGWRWSILLWFIVILLVGYSRVYLGVHWPSDVLAGYLVGGVWILIVQAFIRRGLNRRLSTADVNGLGRIR